MRSQKRLYKLLLLFLTGLLLLNFPIIKLFGKGLDVQFIPLALIYIFAVWIVLILATRSIIDRTHRKKNTANDKVSNHFDSDI